MTHRTLIYERLTHHYNDDCAHLDQWSNQGWTIKVLPGKAYEPYYGAMRDRRNLHGSGDYIGMEEGGRSHFNVVLKGVRPKKSPELGKFQRVLRENFTMRGCSCEYDCCGCASYYVKSLRRVGRWEWHIELQHTLNY